MTTPKPPPAASAPRWRRRAAAIAAGLAGLLAASGCYTPGPLHLYSVTSGSPTVHDLTLDPDEARDAPSYLTAADRLTGFAYDPFADHFFLRLTPGNHIRVVDRPARKIKREMEITGVPADAGGDLAVSSRDGHLFLIDASGPAVFETTRLGRFLRRVPLAGRSAPAAAVSFDLKRDELLVLDGDGRTVTRFDRHGNPVGTIRLERQVQPSIAYDWSKAKLYAPLAGAARAVGVFDAAGQLQRTVQIADGDRFIAVGPHSFLRMF